MKLKTRLVLGLQVATAYAIPAMIICLA